MPIEIRPLAPGDSEGMYRNDGRAFGFQYTAEDLVDRERIHEPDRFLVAVDGGEVVGATGAFSKDLTLPGGATVPAAAVTWVSVAPTHRRRGILRSLMDRQLRDVADRGEPLAILTASEGGIYGRFGYGVASTWRRVRLDTQRAVLVPRPPQGTVRFVDGQEARRLLPLAYERYRRGQPGALSRNDAWWDFLFLDREPWRHGASARFDVVHLDAVGNPDGFATYRIATRWDDGQPRSELRLVDFGAATSAAHADLWAFLLGIDLVATIDTWMVPLDDPLPWLLTDWRQVVTTAMNDFLWVRILDVAEALSRRCYRTADRLVLDVGCGFGPASGGRFVVEGDPAGGSCRRTDVDADLVLDVADLGAVFLGGLPIGALARAGRVEERTPGALVRADAFFGWTRLPHCTTAF